MAAKQVHIEKPQMDIIPTTNMAQRQEATEKHLPDTILMTNTELKQEVLKQIQMPCENNPIFAFLNDFPPSVDLKIPPTSVP